MRIDRRALLRYAVSGAAAVAWVARGAPARAASTGAPCAERVDARPALDRLQAVMAQGRFVAYEPTSVSISVGQVTPAEPSSIREDLRELRSRFDGLITYGALNGHEAIPDIAAELGFRALIIGVWDPFNPAELEAAFTAARLHPRLVVGLSLGNEMIFAGRRRPEDLTALVASVRRRAPALPLSTTEPFHIFYGPATRALQSELDFMLVNVHPVFQPWFRRASEAQAVAFVMDVVRRLGESFCGPILVKETGVPTAPASAGFTPARQADFYVALRAVFAPSPRSAFAYFAAFDAPWRVADAQASPGVHPEEAHWGLYDERRRAKPVVAAIPNLEVSPAATILPPTGLHRYD